MKKTLILAVVFLMAIPAMAGSDSSFRLNSNQLSFNQQATKGGDYTRREGFLLHLGANNGLSLGAGYQFTPHVQAYGEAGLSGYTFGGRYYANESHWSFMADLALGYASVSAYKFDENNDAVLTTAKGFGVKGIVGASYKSFDFGFGGWLCDGKFWPSIMAEWNIRFGKD